MRDHIVEEDDDASSWYSVGLENNNIVQLVSAGLCSNIFSRLVEAYANVIPSQPGD